MKKKTEQHRKAKPQRSQVQAIIAKAPPTAVVHLCPTASDAAALARLGFVAVSIGDVDVKHLRDRHVVIIDPNKQDASQKAATTLDGSAASIKIIDLDGTDIGSWIVSDPAGARLVRITRDTPLFVPAAVAGRPGRAGPPAGSGAGKTDEEMIIEAAALGLLDYAQRRKPLAKLLGISTIELDRLVSKARKERDLEIALYDHWAVEPSDKSVNGGVLLQALIETLHRYVFMTDDQAVAIALWIIFSWLHETMTHSPILFVTSAEADSGKTTLLGVISFLVRRGMPNVEISGPALFRSIKKWQPCLIVDEADDAFNKNTDLRSVVNSGWTRGSGVVRCDPDSNEPVLYSTFATKAIAMKGRRLADTTLSRCIIITMKPQLPVASERKQDFYHLDNEVFAELRSQIMRYVSDNVELVGNASHDTPDFHNRRRANWMPLLQIASHAGDQWKAAAWKSAVAIEAIHDTFDPSIGVQLLAAIHELFETQNTDRLMSKLLVKMLTADQTGPWIAFGKSQNPITENGVARLLKPFGIRPRTVRDANDTAKGYQREWFDDVFDRYLAKRHFSSVILSQLNNFNDLEQKTTVTSDLFVTDENTPKPLRVNKCDGVTVAKAGLGESGTISRCAQCGSDPDGTERQHLIDDDAVLLHDDCVRFYVKERQA